MTTSQIRCFLAAAEYQSFSKAASHLFISQPAVSKQIASLEADLGLTLIERTPMGVGLTEGGKMLYDFFISPPLNLRTYCPAPNGRALTRKTRSVSAVWTVGIYRRFTRS